MPGNSKVWYINKMGQSNGKSTDILPTFEVDRYRWLRQRSSLDLMEIDQELQELPILVQECGERVALAIEIRDSAKEELEKTKSEVAEAMRIESAKSGKEFSESKIDSKLPSNSIVEAKRAELSIARLDAALWSNLNQAIQAKQYLIRTAAELIVSGYISKDFIVDKRRKELRSIGREV